MKKQLYMKTMITSVYENQDIETLTFMEILIKAT